MSEPMKPWQRNSPAELRGTLSKLDAARVAGVGRERWNAWEAGKIKMPTVVIDHFRARALEMYPHKYRTDVVSSEEIVSRQAKKSEYKRAISQLRFEIDSRRTNEHIKMLEQSLAASRRAECAARLRLADVLNVIANDSHAFKFQSFGQYRKALLEFIAPMLERPKS